MTPPSADLPFEDLLKREALHDLGDEEALGFIGALIDSAADRSDIDGLERGIRFASKLRERNLNREHTALSYYFEANAWEDLRRTRRTTAEMWEWEQEEYHRAIIALRHAHRRAAESSLPAVRRAQIATNLGNALSHVGRVVEAIEYWNIALERVDGFAMALSNRGHGLVSYGQRTHDPGHQFVLVKRAWVDLRAARETGSVHPEAGRRIDDVLGRLESGIGADRLQNDLDLATHPLGESPEEQAYRHWCLQQILFLNPLNDLGYHTIAAADPLMLPGITTDIDEGPNLLGFFNQMKQEFTSARFFLYQGVRRDEPHYADRHVKLVNTLDYPIYSLGIEQVKNAFRAAYSTFDKVAFFLNEYLGLGIPEKRVSFRTLWFSKQDPAREIVNDLVSLRNVPLMALFWLSQDLYETDAEFVEVLEPEAKEIANLRNHIEHKYLKVHEAGWRPMSPELSRGLADSLAHSINRNRFEARTLRIMKLARASLIYLSQVVYWEEARRNRDTDGPILPMMLDTYEDDWKV